MLHRTSAVGASAAAVIALLWLAGSAVAAPTSSRPSGGTFGQCIDDSAAGRSDMECEGAICSCCYTDGCFICENNPNVPSDQSNCHWEPPYRVQGRDGIILQPGGILDPGPAAPPSSQRPTVSPADGATQ